jgi:hypothetical protein
MSKLTFTQGRRDIVVSLDDKVVGFIKRVPWAPEGGIGYQYFPKDQKTGGEKFPTLRECKKSLEAQ